MRMRTFPAKGPTDLLEEIWIQNASSRFSAYPLKFGAVHEP